MHFTIQYNHWLHIETSASIDNNLTIADVNSLQFGMAAVLKKQGIRTAVIANQIQRQWCKVQWDASPTIRFHIILITVSGVRSQKLLVIELQYFQIAPDVQQRYSELDKRLRLSWHDEYAMLVKPTVFN